MWIYEDDIILKTTAIKDGSEEKSLKIHFNLIHETLNIMQKFGIKADASDQGIGSCLFKKSKVYVLKDTDETIPEEDAKNYRSDEIEEREINKINVFYSAKFNKVN
uniref:N-acetyltransferase domain-containing protein n=1 Tax=Strongyloides venezuelensis TaxID=75913 RepID=A0A0K0F1B3_STRVS